MSHVSDGSSIAKRVPVAARCRSRRCCRRARRRCGGRSRGRGRCPAAWSSSTAGTACRARRPGCPGRCRRRRCAPGCSPRSCCVSMSIVAAAVHRLDGVVHEVDDDAADLLRIDADTFGSASAKCAPELDVGEEPLIERQRVVQQRVQVGRHGARRRHARELRELVDQPLQRLDLADDRRRALLDQRARRLRRLRRSGAAAARRTAESASAGS